MLQQLYIKNYALIEETRVHFDPGFITITGETGAGKSILLGALGLVVGNRADTTVLRNKEEKCIVEAQFDIQKLLLQSFFSENELDYDDLCIIRREILPGGKSRAFVNDTPVQVTVLKTLGDFLIDIHSQHETLLLRDEKFQTETLDLFTENKNLLEKYRDTLKAWKTCIKQLDELRSNETRIKGEQDFIQFQYSELEQAALKEGEQEILEQELQKGEHAEEIKTTLSSALFELEEGEQNLSSRLFAIRNALQKLAGYDTEIKENTDRLQQLYLELKDISKVLERLRDDTEFDPATKQAHEERLDLIYTLQKKHRVAHIKDLIELKIQFEKSLEQSSGLDENIERLQQQVNQYKETLSKLCDEIHNHRVAAIPYLQKDTVQVLQVLGMPDARLEVSIDKTDDFNAYGSDKIKYLFSANKGMNPEDISKVASGGEISRLMLALKALISGRKNQPTIIFDEIDTGVSGNIADKLGQVMQRMGKNQQVLSITHLPQIASKGTQHLKVEKKEINHKTVSLLKPLTENERIEELASMLSGADVTEEAIRNARVLLGI